jgi:hypothetical protein
MERKNIKKYVLAKLEGKNFSPKKSIEDKMVRTMLGPNPSFSHVLIEKDGDYDKYTNMKGDYLKINHDKKEVIFRGKTGDFMYVMSGTPEDYKIKRA